MTKGKDKPPPKIQRKIANRRAQTRGKGGK